MNKEFAKYMKCGKKVQSVYTAQVYKLIEDMSANKDMVKAVDMDNWSRYELLNAWIRNWDQNSMGFRERFTENIEDCKAEMQGCEAEVRIDAVSPYNKVRFITSGYETKFEVKDLTYVLVNGKAARVAYIDDCHFTFVDTTAMNLYGGCFHISQFAELCEKNGIEVSPIKAD